MPLFKTLIAAALVSMTAVTSAGAQSPSWPGPWWPDVFDAQYPDRDLLNGGALTPAGRMGLAVRLLRLLSLGQTTLMRQTMPMRKWAALVPHSEPGAIAPTTTQRTASSAMMVAAIHLGECESQGEPE